MEVWDLILGSLGQAWSSVWWIATPLVLFFLTKDLWLIYIRILNMRSIKWITLEIKFSKEVLKTPQAMEQAFNSIYAIYSYGFKFPEVWWDGKVERWVAFEIMGREGEMRFFVRTPNNYRNLIEAAIFAQWPDAEIEEEEDYMERLPKMLPNSKFDLWGTDFILVKENILKKVKPIYENL